MIVGIHFPVPGGLRQAFRWSPEDGLVDLGWGCDSSALGVSADGSTIVGEVLIPTIPFVAFGQDESGSLIVGEGAVTARAVSNDGSVIVGNGDFGNGVEAFRWSERDGVVPLGDLPVRFFGALPVTSPQTDRLS